MIKILSYQSNEWWDTLTVTQQKEYLKLHPKSKRKVKTEGPTPAKKVGKTVPISTKSKGSLIFKAHIKSSLTAGEDLMKSGLKRKKELEKSAAVEFANLLHGKIEMPNSPEFNNKIDGYVKVLKLGKVSQEEKFLRMMFHEWSVSTSYELPILMQQRCALKFKTNNNIETYDGEEGKPLKLSDPSDQTKLEKAIDTIIDLMYNKTQELLKANGIKGLYLHRGWYPSDSQKWKFDQGNQKLSKRTALLNPMSSFSSDMDMAEEFGTHMIHMYVPADRILTCALHGTGCFTQSEYIVIGSKEPEKMWISNRFKDEGRKFGDDDDWSPNKGREPISNPWEYIKRDKEIASVL